MLATWFELLFLFQPEAAGSPTPAESAPPAGTEQVPAGCGGIENLGLLVVMFAVMYFLILRPNQRQQKQRDAMLKALKKGDAVRTSGGIRGEITALSGEEVTLLVAPKVKLQVAKQNILGTVGPDGKVEEGDDKKKGESKAERPSKGDEG